MSGLAIPYELVQHVLEQTVSVGEEMGPVESTTASNKGLSTFLSCETKKIALVSR